MSARLPTFGVLITFLAIATACTYDWGVGPAPTNTQDAGGIDTGPETSGEDTGVVETGPEASGTCVDIIAQLDQRRPAATECLPLMIGTECTETGKDECGCNIGGVYPAPFDDYLALVEEFHQNDCTRSCPGCATSIAPKCKADDNGGPPHCE